MVKRIHYCWLILLALMSFGAEAACVAVGPTSAGNASGSSWTNRAAISVTKTRGNTYYLMDGSYGSYIADHANSGTTRIIFKKAQAWDYGRTSDGCGNDISSGWNAGTMGSSQASFDATFEVGSSNTGYITLDGNGRSGAQGCGAAPTTGRPALDCGIKVSLPQGNDAGNDAMVMNLSCSGCSNTGWIVRFVELVGCNCSLANSQSNETIFKCRNGTCNDTLLEHIYAHSAGCDYIKPSGTNAFVVRNSYFDRNDDVICHSQWFLSDGAISNVDVYNNVIRDIGGTAIFSDLNGGNWSNFRIFNNIITWSASSPGPGLQNGIIAIINASSVGTNIQFIGNSIINLRTQFNGAGGIQDENGGGSHTWQNNLYYLCSSDQGGTPVSFSLGGSTFTEGNNTWLGCSGGLTGTGDINTSATNPFRNYTGTPPDYRLSSSGSNWNSGTTKSSPMNLDARGFVRGADGSWERGAYEYVTSPTAPTPN